MRHITNKIRQLCSANKLVACSSNSFEHSFFVHNVQNRKCAGKSISSRRWFSDRLPVTNATNGRSKNELSKNHLLKPELKKPNVHTDLEEEDEDDIFDGEEEPYSLGREQEVMNMLLYDGCGDVKYSQWGGAFLKEFPSIKTDSPTDHQRIEDVSHLACSNCERMGHTEEQCSAPEATQLGKKDSKVGRVKEAVITKRQIVMQKVGRSIGAKVFVGGKQVNCKYYRLLSTLSVRSPTSSSKEAILQPSCLLLNNPRVKSTFATNLSDVSSASLQDRSLRGAIPLDDYLSQHASTSSDLLAGQKDTFNAALAAGKFEFRFLFPVAFKSRINQTFVEELQEKFGAELELFDYGQSECLLRITCAQEDILDCMDEVLPKLRSDAKIICLLVHISHAGGIIGKQKKTLNSIMAKCSLSSGEINVFREACSNSTDNIIQLQTTLLKLPKLIEVLAEVMHSEPIEGIQLQYNAKSYDAIFADKFSRILVEKKEGFQERVAKNSSIFQLKIDVPVALLPQINGNKNATITRIRRLSSTVLTIKKSKSEAESAEMGILGSMHQIQFVAYLIKKALNGVDINSMYALPNEFPKFVTAEMSTKPKREKNNVKKYWFE